LRQCYADAGTAAWFRLYRQLPRFLEKRGFLERDAESSYLALTSNGNIRCQLKTAYRDGTTHFIFEPLDFIAKLAALAWPAAFQPARESDAFSWGFRRNAAQPNSKFRVRVTPAERGRGRKRRQPTGENWLDKTPAERHASMTCTPRA
jgi:hypothetical protein